MKILRQAFWTVLFVAILLSIGGDAQRPTRLYRRCSASITPALVEIQRDGDIDLVPCSGRNVLVNGSATSNTITFTGSSRTNFFPYFTTNTNLGKSPFSWNATWYEFNNTALDATFLFKFTPSIAAGLAVLGDPLESAISIDDAAETITAEVNGGNTQFMLDGGTNAISATAGGTISLNGSSQVSVTSTGSNIVLDAANVVVTGASKFRIDTAQTPASATAACTTGQIAWDANFVYVCINTNTWKRSAIATW